MQYKVCLPERAKYWEDAIRFILHIQCSLPTLKLIVLIIFVYI